jgi:hypothetical protein
MVRDKFSNFQITRKQTEKYENGNKQQKEKIYGIFEQKRPNNLKFFFNHQCACLVSFYEMQVLNR